ncbi:hypothetical protein G6O69_35295 [Pseudenhygromyxa sp. WMMC2535]|uniref:DUF4397 domain-containing protein n=1 Tax=Pseudenhygromyxa sp. WMMC2535 TaxID=2712867 RepID=UPI0015566630|nr:DUF4397 domain-containing protein [Pseudenhygromyxa sp. WMMC2535]NVB43143.1 hypothetical protein [Pseudenhygromyxa sp. WMMC2535]
MNTQKNPSPILLGALSLLALSACAERPLFLDEDVAADESESPSGDDEVADPDEESSSSDEESSDGEADSAGDDGSTDESSSDESSTDDGESSSDEGSTDDGESSSDEGSTDDGESSSDEGSTDDGESSSDEGSTDDGESSSDESSTDDGESSSGEDLGFAQVRTIYASGQPGHIFMDDSDIAIFFIDVQEASPYIEIPAGMHTFKHEDSLDEPVYGPIELEDGKIYSLVNYEATESSPTEIIIFEDDPEGIDPATTRLHFAHLSADMSWWPHSALEFDIIDLDTTPPAMHIDDLQFRADGTIDVPVGPHTIGFDPDDNLTPALIYELPEFPGGEYVNIYTNNIEELGGEIETHYITSDGTYGIIIHPSEECGNGVILVHDQCEGEDFGTLTCEFYGKTSGTLTCTELCEVDTSSCLP